MEPLKPESFIEVAQYIRDISVKMRAYFDLGHVSKEAEITYDSLLEAVTNLEVLIDLLENDGADVSSLL